MKKLPSAKNNKRKFWLILGSLLPIYSISLFYYVMNEEFGMSLLFGTGVLISLPAMAFSELGVKNLYHFELGSFIIGALGLGFLPGSSNVLFVLTSVSFYVFLRGIHIFLFAKRKSVILYCYVSALVNFSIGTYYCFHTNSHEPISIADGMESFLHNMTVLVLSTMMSYTVYNKAAREHQKLKASHSENVWYSNLFNIASHNLRGPLSSIIANMDIISHHLQGSPIEKTKRNFERIYVAEQQLQKIINQWVNPGRIIKSENFTENLLRFVESFEEVKVRLPNNSISLSTFEQTALILGLEVFIDNAIEHAKAAQIQIDLSTFPKITIQDNGIGMNEEKVALFGTPQPSQKGNGLGTYFAKNLLEQVGFKLFLKSSPGAGTHISIVSKSSTSKIPRGTSTGLNYDQPQIA